MKWINAGKMLSGMALVLLAGVGQAQVVKFEFTATGSTAQTGGDLGAIPALAQGTKISGVFYYDLSTPPDVSQSGTDFDSKTYNSLNTSLTFSANTGYSFAPGANAADSLLQPTIDIRNYHAAGEGHNDALYLYAYNIDGGIEQQGQITLIGKNGHNTFNSVALPSALSLGDFDGTLQLLWQHGDNFVRFEASIDTLQQVAAVPEPETYAMLGAGLLLMGALASRRQRQPSA